MARKRKGGNAAASAPSKSGGKKGKKGKKVEKEPHVLLKMLRDWHAIGAGVFVAAVVALAQVVPKEELPEVHAATTISYELKLENGDVRYRMGMDDLYFVAFATAALICVRSILRFAVFFPVAQASGVEGKEDIIKFAEQAWQVLYYSTAWITGFHILRNTPEWEEWWDMRNMWIDYPHRDLTLITKLYYTVQLAFWISQVVVTLIEKWRGDFVEMMIHHFVTITLVAGSYFSNFTRIGIVVLVEQDFADIFLPLAKMLKYAKATTVADGVFAWFALTWIITRHGIFWIFYYSICVDMYAILDVDTHWDPENGAYFALPLVYFMQGLLAVLQVLMLYWLSLLIAAVKRAITSTGTIEDQRSDVEDEGDATTGTQAQGGDDGDIEPVAVIKKNQ